jgi:hypothetical protein
MRIWPLNRSRERDLPPVVLSRSMAEALAPPDPVGEARQHGERLISICREVQSREGIREALVSFATEMGRARPIVHPALARELSKPEHEGALAVLQAACRLGDLGAVVRGAGFEALAA